MKGREAPSQYYESDDAFDTEGYERVRFFSSAESESLRILSLGFCLFSTFANGVWLGAHNQRGGSNMILAAIIE